MRFDVIRAKNVGVLTDVNLDLTAIPGKIIGVTGANGAGKSTLLGLLAGAMYRDVPTRGTLGSLARSRDSMVEVKFVNGSPWTLRHLLDGVSGAGESIVLREDGTPAFDSAKRRSFDAWAAKHLPPPEVLYSSIFSAQQSGGFLDMKPTERKACLLRILGVEQLEALAERARGEVRDAKVEAAKLRGRLQVLAGVDPIEAMAELEQAEQTVKDAEGALAEARAVEEAARAYAVTLRRLGVVRQELRDLEVKRANNAALLPEADRIRHAAARTAELRETVIPAADAEIAEVTAKLAAVDAERAAVLARFEAAERRLDGARGRAAAAARPLADEQRITDALASLPGLRAAIERANTVAEQLPPLDKKIADLAAQLTALAAEERAITIREEAANRKIAGARDRIAAAQRVLVDEAVIANAIRDVEAVRLAIEQTEAEEAAAKEQVEALANSLLDGAGGRIAGLRAGLDEIATEAGHGLELRAIATHTLAQDDAAKVEIETGPERLKAARAELAKGAELLRKQRDGLAALERTAARAGELEAARAASAVANEEIAAATAEVETLVAEKAAIEPRRSEVEAARRAAVEERNLLAGEIADLPARREALAVAERTAARAGEVDAARAAVAAANEEIAAATAEVEALVAAKAAIEPRRAAIFHELQERQAARTGFAAEIGVLADHARRANHLENAEARIAELDPQIAKLRAERAELEAIPAADDTDHVGPAETRLAACRARRERAALSLEQATKTAADRKVVEAELAEVDAAIADYTLLADSLGKDGLQALEADVAAAQLSEMANDLLRTCVSTRWTVSIETTRASADGKKEIETCDVRVLDTERGRDALVETLSGGERVLIGEALSLAITMLVCQRNGITGASLIRDESGAALDAVNSRAYVAMLRRAVELANVHQLLLVSHSPDVQALCDSRIVVADGKVSVA